ncbi:uncharacterized protein [Nicotiana tomentosiformis]|uniref:uncharacterized protein n=1 Tax=Nicotiana tomentosiformis TaxID=4098 RepID=UPI00388C4A20
MLNSVPKRDKIPPSFIQNDNDLQSYLFDVTIDEGAEVPIERFHQGSKVAVAPPPSQPPILEVDEERVVKDGFNGSSDDLHEFSDNEMYLYSPEDTDGEEELPDIVSWTVRDEGLVDSLATQHRHPDDFNQNLTYWRSCKIGEIAKVMIRDTQEEGYALLEVYCHVMLSYNEGSIVGLKVDDNVHFRYFFLSVGAFIKRFAHMRKVIAIDWTFLSGRYGSCLLSAMEQDTENHIFSIAFCVVDKECDDCWTYIFEQLRHIVDNSDELCIISIGIYLLVMDSKRFLLSLIMFFCICHIAEDMCKRFHCEIFIKYFFYAAQSYSTEEFFDHFQQLHDKSREAANCLANEIMVQKWRRAFFPENRYSVLTTNIAKSLNAMLKDQRDFPIIGLFNHIIRKFVEKFEEWHNEMKDDLSLFVPSTEKKIMNNMIVGDVLRVHQLENNQFSVVGHYRDAIIDLDLNTCSCF